MLTGTASVVDLMEHASTMPDFGVEPTTLGGVDLLKVLYETPMASRTDALPAGLHPCNPPTMIIHVWRVADSPWGPFSMAEARIGCRSGTRPRGLVVGCIIDGAKSAADALAERWGFPVREGEVHLDQGYDRTAARIGLEGRTVCELEAVEPEPLGVDDIAWTTTVNLAHTPNGARLVQVDVDHRLDRSERLRPHFMRIAEGWIHPAVTPSHPVSAAITSGTATMPAIRFVARPDELAFTGTERVG